MALVNCPECNRKVSDKAVSCPRCGYPFEEKKAMLEAANSGELGTARELIKQGTDVNARDEHGITPLMLAAFQSHAALVKELLEAGADVNAKRDGGYTALMDACYRGNPRIVEMLIQAGADLYVMNDNGNTALMIAARNKQRDIVALLREAMAASSNKINSAPPSVANEPVQKAPAAPAQQAPSPVETEKPVASAEQENVLIAGDRKEAFLAKARAEQERRMVAHNSKKEETPKLPEFAAVEVDKPEENLVACSRCGQKVTPDAYVCPNCGDLILLKFCPQCYKTIPQENVACPHCGAIVDNVQIKKFTSDSSRLPLFMMGIATFVIAFLIVLWSLDRDKNFSASTEMEEPAAVEQKYGDEMKAKERTPGSTVSVSREASRRTDTRSERGTNAGGRPPEKTLQNQSLKDERIEKPKDETQSIVTQALENKNAIGRRLNSVGYRLLQQGKYGEAVAVLRQAVQAFPENTKDIQYAYALFNLGHALRMSGRPHEAIPVLEQRLAIPDQQTTVMNELRAARRDAQSKEIPVPDEGQTIVQPETAPPEDPEERGLLLNMEENQEQIEETAEPAEPVEELPEEENAEEPPL